jgi:hypothetical protein
MNLPIIFSSLLAEEGQCRSPQLLHRWPLDFQQSPRACLSGLGNAGRVISA